MKLRCPKCQKKLSVPDHHAGKGVRCPVCHRVFNVPKPRTAVGAPATGGDMDLENLAQLEQQSTEFSEQELRDAQTANAAAKAKQRHDPNERVCPNCGRATRVQDPYADVLCSNCWSPIPSLIQAPTTAARKREAGLLDAGGFYANLGTALAYPIPALSSLLWAAVAAFAAGLVPVAVITALANVMELGNSGAIGGIKKADLSMAQLVLIGVFALEILVFSVVALHLFLDVIRSTTVGTEAPPKLSWHPSVWGRSLFGFVVLAAYGVVMAYFVLLLTVQDDLLILFRTGQVRTIYSQGGTSLIAGLVVISLGIPMNLVGLGLGTVMQAIHPVRVAKSIIATHVHYLFLVVLLSVYSIMFASAFSAILFDWFIPQVGKMVSGSAEGQLLNVALPLLAWGVVMAFYFYGTYVLARLHGLFARAFRKKLQFGTT